MRLVLYSFGVVVVCAASLALGIALSKVTNPSLAVVVLPLSFSTLCRMTAWVLGDRHPRQAW